MPKTHTFFITERVTLNADGTGTWQYTVGNGEVFDIHGFFTSSTGAYDITDIRDSTGLHYTNASVNNPIPSVDFPSGANENNHIGEFPQPIHIDGGVTIYVDVIDTSGSGNVVDLLMITRRTLPNL